MVAALRALIHELCRFWAIDPDRYDGSSAFMRPTTNFVIVRTIRGHAPATADAIRAAGVGCLAIDRERIRFVVHLEVDDHHIAEAAVRIRRAFQRMDSDQPNHAAAR